MATKTVAVLDQSELGDGQMKEVDFEQGKVLLSRIGDKIHATSAFCTHYGAPLAKGVLTADGRVVCPWHGACFNVCNGDIEDAPAPSALHSFEAQVKDGKIHVTANPQFTLKDNKSRPPKLSTAGFDSVGKGTVIIGGGSGAFQAVESLREHGYKFPITVISKEPHAPIDRTKLSKALITDASQLEWKTAADLKIKYGVNLRVGVEATSVDFKSRKVVLDDGKDSVAYDKLIIAPGGTPRRLPIPGSDFENVYTFRGVHDARNVDTAAQEGKKVVVIGSSFISMELVVALSKKKLASIDVIGMEDYPFEAVLGKEIGAGLQKYHESQGVKFHMKSKVDKITPQEDNPSLAGGVVVNGQTLPADFVVMGVGVAPATEFLKESGIELEKNGAIQVDEYLRVTKLSEDSKGVFAIGMVLFPPSRNLFTNYSVEQATWHFTHSTERMFELSTGMYVSFVSSTAEMSSKASEQVAGNHGRAVGKTIAGSPQPFVKTPVFWSAQGQQLRYCGYSVGYDDIVIKGDLGEMKFVAYYAKQGKIVAVASMQNDPVVSKASELLRLGLMPSLEEVKAGKSLNGVNGVNSNNQPGPSILPTPPVATRKRKRAPQYTVSYSEVQEVDSEGRLRDVIVIEDTPPPNTLSPATTVGGHHSVSYQPPIYSAPIRTRARAAAEAQGVISSSSSVIAAPPTKKRRRENDDLRAPPSKKTIASSQTTQAIAYTKSDSKSGAATDDTSKGPVSCDDKEGHYIIVPDDIIHNRYRTVRLLGQGTFGKVVEAVDTQTNNRVAIKIIRAIPKYRDASKIEVRVLQKLKEKDPHNTNKCIHLLQWFDHRNHICLVSELLGMCLFDFLKENEFAPFPRHHIQAFARQLLGSVSFLHRESLIHTDLKPENILLVHNDYRVVDIPVPGKRNAVKPKRILQSTDIRLIDFGSATFEKEYHSQVVATRHYRAPEIILGLGWSYPCDAYSLGCILVEFFTGVALFQTHDNLDHLAMMEVVMGKMPERFARAGARSKPEFFKEGAKLDWPKPKGSRQSKKDVRAVRPLADIIPQTDLINRHFLDLVRKLLAFDPAQRITVAEALRHPYFSLHIPEEV
ncbi:Apoptosis-inducing factor 1 [Marasmius tenuissimus]|uniref:Apoptosis-inducing factor 1 n=1 Tax=Marasmius tenuissimus TaxID=585030 RepID=A0ABR2ZGN9_9AGAR